MCGNMESSMENKDIRHIISEGKIRGLTPYEALLEADIIKCPDKDFIKRTYDFSTGNTHG